MPAELYPESNEAAAKAVQVRRKKDDPEAGVASGAQPWTIEDYSASLASRQRPLFELINSFLYSGEKIWKALWPGEARSRSAFRLSKRLNDAEGCINSWKDSAARAACKFTLDVVMSWYRGIDLRKLMSRRKLKEGEVSEHAAEDMHARACALAEYVVVDEYVPSLEEETEEDDSEETGGGKHDGEESSSDSSSDASQ